jgi:hypothetical protein
MYNRNSANATQSNKDILCKNLTIYEKAICKRGNIDMELKPLSTLCRLPSEYLILGRYWGLTKQVKCKKNTAFISI